MSERLEAKEAEPAHGTVERPVGEEQGEGARFTVDEIASAFKVAVDRIERAVAGEFGASRDDRFDSQAVQHLAEVVLGDQPIDQRQAALMTLGAFTPRTDADYGLGDARPDEESDRQAARADVPATERASNRSSHDPATQLEE